MFLFTSSQLVDPSDFLSYFCFGKCLYLCYPLSLSDASNQIPKLVVFLSLLFYDQQPLSVISLSCLFWDQSVGYLLNIVNLHVRFSQILVFHSFEWVWIRVFSWNWQSLVTKNGIVTLDVSLNRRLLFPLLPSCVAVWHPDHLLLLRVLMEKEYYSLKLRKYWLHN